MCNCKHSTIIGDDHHSEHCQIDPSISVGEGWQSGYDDPHSYSEEYRTAMSSGMHTPRRGIPRVMPAAPLKQKIARFPELASGVAIVRKRLDFDDSTFDDPGFSGHCPPFPAESQRSRRMSHSVRPCPPRMTQMTACGKCLRM